MNRRVRNPFVHQHISHHKESRDDNHYPDPHRSGRAHRYRIRRCCRGIRRQHTDFRLRNTRAARRRHPPEDFADEARQCWANVESALGKAGAKLTDIVSVRHWLTSRDDLPAYLPMITEIIHHEPAAMLSIIDGLVWPNLRLEVEVVAIVAT